MISSASHVQKPAAASMKSSPAKPPAGAPASAGAWAGSTAPKSAPDATHIQCIAERAYFIAQKRQFIGGDPIQDWLQAERSVGRPPTAQHLATCTK
jgi:hypothetical protein